VRHIVGIAKSKRLLSQSAPWRNRAQGQYEVTAGKQRVFASIQYGARTWDRSRRVIVKASFEHHPVDTVENGCGDPTKHPPYPNIGEQCLRTPGLVPHRGPPPEHFLTATECCPGTLMGVG